MSKMKTVATSLGDFGLDSLKAAWVRNGNRPPKVLKRDGTDISITQFRERNGVPSGFVHVNGKPNPAIVLRAQ